MPPKQAKKGSAKKSSAQTKVNKNWEADLIKAELEEESWRACVSFVVGGSPEEEELIQVLALAAQKPLRRLFSLLTWDSTLAKIQELGNPKAKKPDDIPMFYEVTEPAKSLLDAGQEIPCDLMAKILKFQLLQIKSSAQQRRERERAEEEKADADPPPAKDKEGAKSSDKKGKRTHSPVEPSTKKKTQLKRRDDVEPPTFIDDEPEDGPQHYILVLGFHQPHLIKALDAVSVQVDNVIKLCSEHTQTSEELQEQHTSDYKDQNVRPASGLDQEAEVFEAAEAKKLDLFWSELRAVLDSGPPRCMLHDVVQLSYSVQDLVPPFNKQDPEAELEVGSQVFEGVAHLIYDSLEWRRQHQHYLNSMKLISVPTVIGLDPQPAEKSTLERNTEVLGREQPPLSTDVDMRYYNNLLDLLPPEACSVPLILDCMLEQVVISKEQSTPHPVTEEPKPPSDPGLELRLLSFMLESFLPLLHTKEEKSQLLNKMLTKARNEEDKKRLIEMFGAEEPPNKSEHTQVIRHHDERALRLREIKVVEGFNPEEVESSMMRLSPMWELIQSVAQHRNSSSSWMAVKQQLQHHCTDDVVPWPEVERLFQQSVFESMPLNKLDQKGILVHASGPLGSMEPAQQQRPVIIPWDNPASYSKQKLDDLRNKGPTFLTENPADAEINGRVSCQLDLTDIQSCRLRSLFDWHYSEHHNSSIFPQVLQLASEEYSCLETFRGSLKNIMYIFCHNPMSPNRQCKELWDVTLHTDVKFRKYLEHVREAVSDWTEKEELKREEIRLRNSRPAESPKEEKVKDSAKEEEEEDTLEPVIRKDSLKAWKLEQERLKEEEIAKKSKKDNPPKSRQQKEEEAKSAHNKKSKALTSGKKSRAETADSSAKTPREPVTTTAPSGEGEREQHPTEELFNGFTGYSMDGKLIHVSGGLQSLFPSDGGHITVENVSFIEGSSLMKVTVKKDGHHLCTHINHVVDDQAKFPSQPQDKEPSVKDFKESEPVGKTRVKQGSLSAVLDKGIRLSYSYYGPTGEHRVNALETETSDVLPSPLSSSLQHLKTEVYEAQPTTTSTPFNSLNLSLPNGLLLQLLKEETHGVSAEEQGILVKQGFPLGRGRGVAGQLQDSSLSKELSRIITSQGAVIRYMRDGSTQVLFADGTVSFGQDSGPVWVPDSDLEEDNPPQGANDTKTSKTEVSEKEADSQRGFWLTTTPSGTRIHTVGTTHKHIPAKPLLAFKATDPITHEVMLSREDLVISVQDPDGSQIVEHADGTRITSIYQDRPPNTLQHLLLHPGKQRGSVPFGSSSVCACGCIECECDTRCAASINEKVQIRDTYGEKTGRSSEREGFGLSECEHRCDDRGGSACKHGEESMFAEENGKKSSCDGDTKEQLVLVEKEGCATVVMYPERHMAHVFLADGTVITGNNQGAYQVFPSSVGLLQIQTDGKCVYTSDPPVTPSPNNGTPTNQPGSYTMSHTDKVACDITDPDGNHFQVMEDGLLSVLNFSPAPSTMKQEEEPEEEEDREIAVIHAKQREHCPRLFVVHEDGSGTELLSSQTVEELLYQAYSDPTIKVLKEPLPDRQDEFGITILKPSQQSVWSQWLLGKQNPNITPPNLRNRTWHDFPRTEVKVPGPPFGTNLGQGLTLREMCRGSAAQRQPVRSCPKVLEIRELCQHHKVTAPLKNTIDTRLKGYIESVMEREQRSEDMKMKEPRTEEEITRASDLLNLVLSFAEEEEAGLSFDKRTSEDIANLYSQGVEAPAELDVSEDTATASCDSLTSGRESKWAGRLAQHRQELSEEKVCLQALRKKNIVPFFHPENDPFYHKLVESASTHQKPDMRSPSMALPPIPRSDSADAMLRDAPQESTPRPLNPTPSQSASHGAESDRVLKKRPTNPQPDTAGQSILRGSSGQTKALQVDVTGKPRRTRVKLPTSILSSKPRSVPNEQFLSVEEPVRRKSRTSSMANPNVIIWGFQLLPSRVHFGTLQEGTSSAITVVMKNVGVDTCRFHVKQPPPTTGLRVIYNPGPVAAGLQVELKVQLFAMCAAQAGEVEPKKYTACDIIIHTETDILYLPVTATILPGRLYDIWLKDHNKKGSKVRRQSSGLPVGQGSIQPISPLAKPPDNTSV
ncbi:sperm-associated antigen 17 isoform X2 [Notolabrus celidotus]|uniref:sperm-associated antigen 17 isoform X2 n=1 Tax=Notolabrus celidotus TaxID=1203425 RepID=UPI00148FE430|nr:sperm-associated antigen 17 isoform X2 [Notolabrus celidotus]